MPNKRWAFWALITVAYACALTGGEPAAADESDAPVGLETPAQVYQMACAACHGADGAGSSQAIVGFDVPLPDFTDCSFASREPVGDWFAVAHDGGPVRGFDRMMPAFEGALSAEQIEMAVLHVKSFCDDDSWPRGELNLPRPLFTEKAYPEDEFVWTAGAATEGSGAVENVLVYEKRFGARNQIEVKVPVDFLEQEDGDWSAGLGDFALAFKYALAHGQQRPVIFSVGAEVILPTGDEDTGHGRGTTVFEPFVAYGQIMTWETYLHFAAAVELPTDPGKAEREALWRAALGRSFTQGAFGRTWSPMLEVLWARAMESGAEAQWDVVPQFQVTLNTRQHVMANVGVRIPVTDSDVRATQVLVYVLWDWFDGGFFDGW